MFVNLHSDNPWVNKTDSSDPWGFCLSNSQQPAEVGDKVRNSSEWWTDLALFLSYEVWD